MNFRVQINAQLQWQLKKTAAGNMLAICEPLDLVLEARDQDEALSLIDECLHYFFLDHLEEGTLERFLQSKGWTANALPPRNIDPSAVVNFEVPWSLATAHAP